MAANTRKRYVTVEEVVEALDEIDEIPSGSEDENLSDEDEEFPTEDAEDIDEDVDTSDDDDDESSGEPPKKKTERIWHWVKKDLPKHVNPENHLVPKGPALNAKSPLDMFMAHLGEDTFELLTMESNRYKQQIGRSRSKMITVQDMQIFIGICFYMSIVSLPARHMYWSPKTRVPAVADLMTLNRFEEILSLLHVNDNELMKKKGEHRYDSLHKIRPLIKVISSNFENCSEPELFVAVDEQIVPFKGRHSLKVYMKKKPKKWGYKIWALGGKSGYVHKFYIAGDNTVVTQDPMQIRSIGKSGEVVINLIDTLAEGSYVFFS